MGMAESDTMIEGEKKKAKLNKAQIADRLEALNDIAFNESISVIFNKV